MLQRLDQKAKLLSFEASNRVKDSHSLLFEFFSFFLSVIKLLIDGFIDAAGSTSSEV